MSGIKARLTKLEKRAALSRSLDEQIEAELARICGVPLESWRDPGGRYLAELMENPTRTDEELNAWFGQLRDRTEGMRIGGL